MRFCRPILDVGCRSTPGDRITTPAKRRVLPDSERPSHDQPRHGSSWHLSISCRAKPSSSSIGLRRGLSNVSVKLPTSHLFALSHLQQGHSCGLRHHWFSASSQSNGQVWYGPSTRNAKNTLNRSAQQQVKGRRVGHDVPLQGQFQWREAAQDEIRRSGCAERFPIRLANCRTRPCDQSILIRRDIHGPPLFIMPNIKSMNRVGHTRQTDTNLTHLNQCQHQINSKHAGTAKQGQFERLGCVGALVLTNCSAKETVAGGQQAGAAGSCLILIRQWPRCKKFLVTGRAARLQQSAKSTSPCLGRRVNGRCALVKLNLQAQLENRQLAEDFKAFKFGFCFHKARFTP